MGPQGQSMEPLRPSRELHRQRAHLPSPAHYRMHHRLLFGRCRQLHAAYHCAGELTTHGSVPNHWIRHRSSSSSPPHDAVAPFTYPHHSSRSTVLCQVEEGRSWRLLWMRKGPADEEHCGGSCGGGMEGAVGGGEPQTVDTTTGVKGREMTDWGN